MTTAAPARIGVVIPSYCNEAFVGMAVDSVHAQRLAPDCVVIDDGSPEADGNVARLHAAGSGRIRVVRQPNAGVGRARNAGAALLGAAADALLFLDADDELVPTALQVLWQALAGSHAVAAFGLAELTDASGATTWAQPAERLGRPKLWSLGELYLEQPVATPSCLLVRRDAFEATGGFGDPPSEDLSFLLRLARLGPVLGAGEVTTRYRKHEGGVTARETDRMYAGIRRIRSDIYRDKETTRSQRREIRMAWRRHNVAKAREARGAGAPARAGGHLALSALPPVDLSRLTRAGRATARRAARD